LRATSILFKRELGSYLRSPIGFIIAALALLIDGVLFQAIALGGGKKLSALVLHQFFWTSFGVTAVAAVALSIRLLAEERQTGTIVLLNTSPVRDVEIVLGKFLSAYVFLLGITLATIYLPLLILVHGKISFAQIAVGYLGLALAGGSVLAMGLFASSLTRHTLVAAVLAIVLVVAFVCFFPLSTVLDPPLKSVFASLDIFTLHYTPFEDGILHLRDVVFYLGLIYFFLLLATKTMEAKRWQ
jgi:ABC-2 type transport system permease protein